MSKDIEEMIDWYKNQIEHCKSNELAMLYNHFHMRGSKYTLTELLPYCEYTMRKILNPKDNPDMPVMEMMENYEAKLDRELTYGTPIYGMDKDAYVMVYHKDYKNLDDIGYFYFYTNGLEGDDELIDGIAVDMTALNKDNVSQFINATGFKVKLYEEDTNE